MCLRYFSAVLSVKERHLLWCSRSNPPRRKCCPESQIGDSGSTAAPAVLARWDQLENRERFGLLLLLLFFNAYIYWRFSDAFAFITTADSPHPWMVLVYNGRCCHSRHCGVESRLIRFFFFFSRAVCVLRVGFVCDRFRSARLKAWSRTKWSNACARFGPRDVTQILLRVLTDVTSLVLRASVVALLIPFCSRPRYGLEFLLRSVGRNRAARRPGIFGPPSV